MADSSSTTITATSTAANPPETKSWADEAEQSSAAAANELEMKIGSLQVDESNRVNSTLSYASIEAETSGDTLYKSAKRFEDLNLSPELLKGLYVEMKFERPSKIQEVSLPMILTPQYKFLIAQAHNGSGKTTCFVLGMLSRIDPKLAAPQALCICPTRELAIQNMEVLLKMGKYTGITSELGIKADSANYIHISKREPIKAQVVIGTPETICNWVSTKKLGMSCMKVLVFDEADHMLAESGFQGDSIKIMKEIVRKSADCQVLLFSATFGENVKTFVTKIVSDLFMKEKKDYNKMFVKKEELSLDSVKQYKVKCPDELSKVKVSRKKILELGQKVGQIIIFIRTKNSASRLHKSLVDDGYEVTTIHGALKQENRDKIIKEFKEGLTQVLIATDLLARGFDQSQVNLVVNYDLPVRHENISEPDHELYLHQIGRAGRFGRKGAVFNLLCDDRDNMLMSMIENHFNHRVTEFTSWRSEEDFENALKNAGLL